MQPTPGRDEFRSLAARHRIVPVAVELLADRDTPVSIFEKAAPESGPAFLLESVEGGEHWARWSFAGWDPLFVLGSRGDSSHIDGIDLPLPQTDPLSTLEFVLDALDVAPRPDLPPLHAGLVGYLAYDVVRSIESLPDPPPDDRGLPDMLWLGVGTLAALDRFRHTVTLVRNVMPGGDPDAAYDRALTALEEAAARLGGPAPGGVVSPPPLPAAPARAARASLDRSGFEAVVRRAVAEIEAGEAFQIVPSLRLEVDFAGDPFAVYRVLRLVNPSPYMFFLRAGEMAVAGSSPELMARVRDGTLFSRPIAGTRPRGATPAEDAALEADLRADPKERAEHVMLVDLARNDVGRVAEYGSVSVDELMIVERYSHVMHLVSGVSGRLRPGVGPVDVLRATFPHGTVSGAPKVRAMEIIDDLEPVARGPYAGAVGYIDFSGNLDTAIALRTMIASAHKAWVQAGAGVVADSVPEREYEECLAKAAAVLTAIEAAPHV